jgi:hypothetical protein
MGIQDAAKDPSATTWQVETLLRKKGRSFICTREAPTSWTGWNWIDM